jgi:hypothetical protein
MGTPQIIFLVLVGLELLFTAYKHGQPKDEKYNIFVKLINAGIIIWILIAGGFFG